MIDRPLQTFSVAFEQRAFSELDYARQVAHARSAPTRTKSSSTIRTSSARCRGSIWHEDEPIAHPSSVPLYFVSALAREHVKVVLTGEGSDELLAGYGKYPRALVELARRRGLRQRVAGAAARARRRHAGPAPAGDGSAAMRTRSFLAMPRTPEAMFFDNFAAIGLAAAGRAARAALARLGDAGRGLRRVARATSTRRTATARCSIGCSIPTSRPIWSSC